jgi:hypothetical protein
MRESSYKLAHSRKMLPSSNRLSMVTRAKAVRVQQESFWIACRAPIHTRQQVDLLWPLQPHQNRRRVIVC